MTAITACNCGNCPKYSEKPHPAYEGNLIYYCGDTRTQSDTKALTQRIGCMLHPKAREVLMGDVVEEFKRQQKIATEGMKSKDDFYSEWQERYCSFRDAIEILLNGGKK